MSGPTGMLATQAASIDILDLRKTSAQQGTLNSIKYEPFSDHYCVIFS